MGVRSGRGRAQGQVCTWKPCFKASRKVWGWCEFCAEICVCVSDGQVVPLGSLTHVVLIESLLMSENRAHGDLCFQSRAGGSLAFSFGVVLCVSGIQ